LTYDFATLIPAGLIFSEIFSVSVLNGCGFKVSYARCAVSRSASLINASRQIGNGRSIEPSPRTDAPWPRAVAAPTRDRLDRPAGRGLMPLASSTPGRAARLPPSPGKCSTSAMGPGRDGSGVALPVGSCLLRPGSRRRVRILLSTAPGATSRSTISSASVRLQRL
jgi:hypothetical protein